MAAPRRVVWCSCTILDYLSGAERAREQCGLIIEAARRGEVQIIVSTMAEIEVAKIDGVLPEEQEEMILEFFDREYVIRHSIDQRIAATARSLMRTYGLRGPDATHIATALLAPGVTAFESYDDKDMDKVRNSDIPLPQGNKIVLRNPTHEGQGRAEDFMDDDVVVTGVEPEAVEAEPTGEPSAGSEEPEEEEPPQPAAAAPPAEQDASAE